VVKVKERRLLTGVKYSLPLLVSAQVCFSISFPRLFL